MRIVYDIDFGSTYSKTHLGIFDFETNTLEYIAKTKLEEKVKKGYQVQDLALKPGTNEIDIVGTVIHPIPMLQKQTDVGSYNKKSWFVLNQPIYFKNIKSGMYFIYKNVTFAYQKRKKGNEWGVVFPQGMKPDVGIQILYQLVPYLMCGSVFILRLEDTLNEVMDFSALASLSNTKEIQLITGKQLFKSRAAIRIAGLMQNLQFGSLFNEGGSSLDGTKLDNLKIVDLSNIYTNEKTDINSYEFFEYARNIPAETLLLFPNIENFAKNSQEGHLRGCKGNQVIEWINLGTIPKKSEYVVEAKKQVAKHSLMGKNIEKYIFYATIV